MRLLIRTLRSLDLQSCLDFCSLRSAVSLKNISIYDFAGEVDFLMFKFRLENTCPFQTQHQILSECQEKI